MQKSLLLLFFLLVTACSQQAGANYVFLYPKSKAEISVNGACRIATNHSNRTQTWIPTNSAEVFSDFHNYPGDLSFHDCAK